MERTFEDQNAQNEMDAELIYNTIEEEIVPTYYDRPEDHLPHKWIAMIKTSLADIAPNFTTNRMLHDYQERFYDKLYERNLQMIAADYTMAREIAAWKRRISAAWDKIRIVSVKQFDMGKEAILIGHKYTVEAVVDTGGVDPKNLGVEMIVANQITDHNVQVVSKRELTPDQARRIAGLLPASKRHRQPPAPSIPRCGSSRRIQNCRIAWILRWSNGHKGRLDDTLFCRRLFPFVTLSRGAAHRIYEPLLRESKDAQGTHKGCTRGARGAQK